MGDRADGNELEGTGVQMCQCPSVQISVTVASAVTSGRVKPACDRLRGAGLSEALFTHQENRNDRPEPHTCGGTHAWPG